MNYSTKVFDFFSNNKKTYYHYLSLNNKTKIISENVSTHLNLLNHKDGRFNHKKIRILCIGGGSGETDLSIIEKLSSKNFVINYVDPSAKMQTRFVAELKKRKLTKTGDIKVSPFEVASYPPPQSDIVLCLNSVYFLKGWKSINKNNPLLKIYNVLDQKGIAVIVLKSDTSPHTKVKKTGNGGNTCGKNIRNILRKLKIPHYWETVSSYIDISSCFKNGKFNPNKKGICLLSFMFKGEWESFSKETKKNISKTIEDKMEITGGKHLLQADYECIWIKKPEKTQNPRKTNNNPVNDETSKLSSILKGEIKNLANFPQPGINFKDMTKILRKPFLFKKIVNYASTKYSKNKIDFVVAKDMQGLIWAGAIALNMGVGVITYVSQRSSGSNSFIDLFP